jgi:GNAT superfamily N-acetyltransferase
MEIKTFQNCWQKQVEKILTQDFFNEFKIPTTKRSVDIFNIKNFYQKTGGNFWVLENNGEILGTIGLKKFDEKVGILKRFFVAKKIRRKGWGEIFLKVLSNFARNENLTKVFLKNLCKKYRVGSILQKTQFSKIEKMAGVSGKLGD